jgi:hypothetical protein
VCKFGWQRSWRISWRIVQIIGAPNHFETRGAQDTKRILFWHKFLWNAGGMLRPSTCYNFRSVSAQFPLSFRSVSATVSTCFYNVLYISSKRKRKVSIFFSFRGYGQNAVKT